MEGTVAQTMAPFLACHQHAFAFFGGIPHTIMVDNLPSAVLQRAVGDAPVLNPTYLDCATHHGCPMAPCHVGKGQEKGRVENGAGYVPKPCRAGRAMPDFSALNPAARHGRATVAKGRRHGATRAPPTVLWQPERPSVRPIPRLPFDIATVSQVRAPRPVRLTVETHRYSVPAPYAGHALTLKTSPDRLCLSLGDQLMARHARRYDRHTDVEAPEHPKPLLEQRTKARDHKVFRRFLALSPPAEAYDLQLEERRLNPHHHVRNIVALSDLYAPEAVARAMADAFVYEAFSSAYAEQRARCTPEASALPLTRRGDLLDVNRAPPALSLYYAPPQPPSPATEERYHHG